MEERVDLMGLRNLLKKINDLNICDGITDSEICNNTKLNNERWTREIKVLGMLLSIF